jgi:2'-5' RNA ligase
MRTFIAVEIPAGIRRQVTDFIDGHKRKTLPVKWVAYENLHITVKFLGEIDADMKQKITAVLQDVCRLHNRFEMGFSGIGCFPDRRRPRVLWIGTEQGAVELTALAHDIDERLAAYGFRQEKRFHPHLTIARMRKPCTIDEILACEFATEPFPVGSVTLFKSTLTPQGPLYDTLATVDLAA